jgi:hypothetical protein
MGELKKIMHGELAPVLATALMAASHVFMPTRRETPMYVYDRKLAQAKAKDKKQRVREEIRARRKESK